MKPRYREAAWLLFLFLLAWAPRALALDAYVSPDERKWLARSANFTYALSHGDFAQTFQREHPGVTVMWAGTLGLLGEYPTYPQEAPGYFTWEQENLEAWLKANTDHTPLDLLAAGRRWIAFGVALTLWLSIFPLHRLIGRNAAISPSSSWRSTPSAWRCRASSTRTALSPASSFWPSLYFLAWLYARSALARPGDLRRGDGAGVADQDACRAARPHRRRAGGADVRAWRRRHHTLPYDPYGPDREEGETRRQGDKETGRQGDRRPSPLVPRPLQHATRNTQQLLTRLAAGYVLWGVIAVATFFLLWPAMWGDPLGSLARMATEMEAYVEGHVNPNFFWGQPTGDPGIFFYPVAIFFRITPGVLIGLIAAAVFYFRRDWTFADLRTRRTVRALTFFVVVFVVAMTVPAKKFDRYVLPIFLALDVLAALGWLALSQLPWRPDAPAWLRRLRTISPTAALLTLAFVLHGLFTALTYPYYLTYYNPLAGGSRTAPSDALCRLGRRAGRRRALAQRPAGQREFPRGSLVRRWPLLLFLGQPGRADGLHSPLSWLDTDYAVTYVNQWQRQLPSPEAVAWFESLTPPTR
jgi:hypothetical protein